MRDLRTGKVVEGEGGVRVLVTDERREERVRAAVRAAAHSGSAEHNPSDLVEEMDSVGSKKTGGTAKRRGGNGKAGKNKNEDIATGDDAHKESFGDGPSRAIESGFDILDNNQVNLFTAAITSVLAMTAASLFWNIPLSSIVQF